MAGRLAQQGVPLLAGVNGSFGLRGDRVGRGGIIFNLHIQDRELVSIAPRRDWWGFPPPSPWGETSFGVTTEGEFLLDAVELNGVIQISGESLEVDCINQIPEADCAAVLYTPRFGEQTLARRSYEVTLKGLESPLTGRYRSNFKINAINRRGNSTIPSNGVVLALNYQLAVKWDSIFRAGGTGKLEIALSPTKWQRVTDGIGGNLRLLREGKIEPELAEFHQSGGRSNYRHRNGARLNPRSALGFNDDKLFLIAVDGRQYGYSIGMTLYEMAGFLRDLGAKHAINFDGGSSSALWGLDEHCESSIARLRAISVQRSDDYDPEKGEKMMEDTAPRAFHVMTKPIGAICNLDCEYCFYLDKENLYPDTRSFRMTDEVLKNYVRQYIESQQVNEITFAWQGGEPTLMGVDFFRRAVEYQQEYRRVGTHIQNTFQTNATLLNDEWCTFFKQNNFLIGISIDGPPELHDKYRYDKRGRPSSDDVIRGLRFLQKHQVDYNILCVVNSHNADYPLEVYRYFKELGAQFMQFIPAVERVEEKGVTDRTVRAAQYGKFLCAIFDEWVVNDIGKIFVQIFDVALEAWLGYNPSLCIFNETCGNAMAIEHNGDLYSCDHYVDPEYFLGNVMDSPMEALVESTFQRKFGTDKRDTLPQYCLDCEVRFVCNGGCPKNRFIKTPSGEDGLNYLCAGYKQFFNHIDRPMKMMAEALQAGRPADSIMPLLRPKPVASTQKVGRNSPCPCGSGKKYKQCCLK